MGVGVVARRAQRIARRHRIVCPKPRRMTRRMSTRLILVILQMAMARLWRLHRLVRQVGRAKHRQGRERAALERQLMMRICIYRVGLLGLEFCWIFWMEDMYSQNAWA